jgi:hypothetical protein
MYVGLLELPSNPWPVHEYWAAISPRSVRTRTRTRTSIHRATTYADAGRAGLLHHVGPSMLPLKFPCGRGDDDANYIEMYCNNS